MTSFFQFNNVYRQSNVSLGWNIAPVPSLYEAFQFNTTAEDKAVPWLEFLQGWDAYYQTSNMTQDELQVAATESFSRERAEYSSVGYAIPYSGGAIWPSVSDYFMAALLYPNVTHLVANGNAPNTTLLAHTIYNGNISQAAEVSSRVATCLVDRCSQSGSCKGNVMGNCPLSRMVVNGTLAWSPTIGCLDSICQDPERSQVNTDVGGIGIRIAYIIQSAFAIFGLVAIELLRLRQRFLHREIRRLRNQSGTKYHVQTLLEKRDRARAHVRKILLNLVDFQKHQCYFAIAAAVAGILSVYSLPDSISFADTETFILLAFAGIVPIVGNFYTLAIYHKRSWYVFLLSFITIALATYLVFAVIFNGPGSSYDHDALVTPCGSFPAWQLCRQFQEGLPEGPDAYNRFYLYVFAVKPTAGFCTAVVAVGLIVRQCRWRKKRSLSDSQQPRLDPNESNSYGAMDGKRKRRKAAAFCKRFYAYVEKSLVFLSYVFYLQLIGLNTWDAKVSQTDFEKWSFGQVVAITTWLPVLAEFVFQELIGFFNEDEDEALREAFDHRLPFPYTIVGGGLPFSEATLIRSSTIGSESSSATLVRKGTDLSLSTLPEESEKECKEV